MVVRGKGLILLLLPFLFYGQAVASAAGFDVYGKVERFSWTEYDAGGKLLEETGPMFTMGLIRKTPNSDRSFTKADIAYFGGSVDYDGATWGGAPVTSDTNYNGFRAEYIFYNPIPKVSGGYAFLGVGYSQWNRDLVSTQVSQGYLEKWKSLYAKFGYRQENARLRFEAGLKYPLKNENSVGDFGSSTIPGQQASAFCEASWALAKDIDVSLTYDSTNFSASAPVYAQRLGLYVYQPESKSDSLGLALKAKF